MCILRISGMALSTTGPPSSHLARILTLGFQVMLSVDGTSKTLTIRAGGHAGCAKAIGSRENVSASLPSSTSTSSLNIGTKGKCSETTLDIILAVTSVVSMFMILHALTPVIFNVIIKVFSMFLPHWQMSHSPPWEKWWCTTRPFILPRSLGRPTGCTWTGTLGPLPTFTTSKGFPKIIGRPTFVLSFFTSVVSSWLILWTHCICHTVFSFITWWRISLYLVNSILIGSNHLPFNRLVVFVLHLFDMPVRYVFLHWCGKISVSSLTWVDWLIVFWSLVSRRPWHPE